MQRIAPLVLLALQLGAAAGASATTTVGPTRRVNDSDARCQNHPLVAPLRSGGFAVAWDRYGGEEEGVHLRLADEKGRLPAGAATLFHGRLLGALLADASGDLVAIWGAATGSGTWMQRLSASGEPLDAEVPLPIVSPPNQIAAVMAPDGRIAVVWPDGAAVKGRWFSASGVPLGPEIDIAPLGSHTPRRFAVAVDSAGRLVAAWSHQKQPGPGTALAVKFRRFDAHGLAAGPEVDVSADALGPASERYPALAAMRDGMIAVAWERSELSGAKLSVWFRRFDGADRPIENPVEAAPGPAYSAIPAFVSDGGDRLALSWYGPKSGALRLLGTEGPPGPELPLHMELIEGFGYYEMPALAFLADGRLAVVWNTFHETVTLPTGCENAGIFERVVDLAPAVRPPRATGTEVDLSGRAPRQGQRPRIAMAPDGGWLAVWEAACNVLRGQVFDAAGNPRAAEVEIGRGPCANRPLSVALAGLPGGGFVAAWTDDGPDGRIRVLRMGPDGQPAGSELAAGSPGSRRPQLAPGAGGFLLAWSEPPSGAILAQPFREDGIALAAPAPVADSTLQDLFDLAALPGGRFVVVWNGSETQVLARLLDAAGVPAGPALPVSTDGLKQVHAHAAPSGDGFAVAWTAWGGPPFELGSLARLRRFGPGGEPRGEVIEADALVDFGYGEEASLLVEDLTSSREGVLWLLVTKKREYPFSAELAGVAVLDGEPLGPPVQIGSGQDIAGASAAPDGCDWIVGWGFRVSQRLEAHARRFEGGCPDRPEVLRLGGGRFLAEVSWHTRDGGSGVGKTRALADDTGAFWFFWQDNLELMLKVLDGRGVNGAFWVFYATLTDVAFDLAITDLETGVRKVYSKPAGRLESRADVNAFPAPGAPPIATPSRWQASLAPQAAAGCIGDGALCLLGSRFRVGVRFTDPRDGTEREAVAVPLTSDAGAYWFFGEDNLELMLKIVDGRALNGRFWVFYGGLSDVEYEITVTDMETGAARVYNNARGKLESRADTGAFP